MWRRLPSPIGCSKCSLSVGEHPAIPGYFLRNHLTKQEATLQRVDHSTKSHRLLTSCFARAAAQKIRRLNIADACKERQKVHGRQTGCACDSLVEGVRQGLHGFDGHQAMGPGGEQRALPHALLPRAPHHQQVILLEGQLLLHLHLLVPIAPAAQRLGEEGPLWAGREIE